MFSWCWCMFGGKYEPSFDSAFRALRSPSSSVMFTTKTFGFWSWDKSPPMHLQLGEIPAPKISQFHC